jgi:microcystin-dependent protein
MIFPCPNPLSQLKAKFDLYYAAINHNHDERYYTEAEVDALIGDVTGAIIGEIRMWSTNSPPSNWLICDGNAISRSTYSGLFDVIGITFGNGDGSTTFNLPDFGTRVPIGATELGGPYRPVGTIGGEEEHTLTIQEMPSHSHPSEQLKRYDGDYGGSGDYNVPEAGALHAATSSFSFTTDLVGGGQEYNNMPPYLAVYFIIYVGP